MKETKKNDDKTTMTSESVEKSLPSSNEEGRENVDEIAASSGNPFIFKVEPNDVLLGRGAPIINNEGNVRFRRVVADRKSQYTASCRHQLKSQIAHDVIEEIVVNRKGRFLRKVDDVSEIMALGNGSIPQGVTSVWVVASDDVILLKVKQALREHDDTTSHSKNTRDGAIKVSRANKKRARESKAASKASKRNSLQGEENGEPDEMQPETHSASTSTLDCVRDSPSLADPNLSTLLTSVESVLRSNSSNTGDLHQDQQQNPHQNSPIELEVEQFQNRQNVGQQQERSDVTQLFSLLPGFQESFDEGQKGNALYQQMMIQQIHQQNRQQQELQIRQQQEQQEQLLLSQLQPQRPNVSFSQLGGGHRLTKNDYALFLESFNPNHGSTNQHEQATTANPLLLNEIKGLNPELNKHMHELQMLEKQYLQSLALQHQHQQQIEQESNALASSIFSGDSITSKNAFMGRSTSPTRQSIHQGIPTSAGMYLHNISVMPTQHNLWLQQNNVSFPLKSQQSQQQNQMQRQLLQQVAGLQTQQDKIASSLDTSFMNDDPQLDAMLRELQDVNNNDPSHMLQPHIAGQQKANDFDYTNFLTNNNLPIQNLLDQRTFGDSTSNSSSVNNGPLLWSSQISNRLDLQAQHQLIQQEHLQRSQQLLLQSTTDLGNNMLDAGANAGDGKGVKEVQTKVNNAPWDTMIGGNEASNDSLESIIQSTNPFL